MKIHQQGIAILARQDKLTDEDWHGLVQARLELIKPYLRDMTLVELGDLLILSDYFGEHDIKRDAPEVNSGKFSLSTRGIFPKKAHCVEYERGPDGGEATAGTYKFWGLTRDLEWITIRIYATRSKEPYKYAGRFEIVERAKSVDIQKSNLVNICTFCETSPRKIWEKIGECLTEWEIHRQRLYNIALGLKKIVTREELLVEIISPSRRF